MEGCGSNAGIIPKAINEIFEYKCKLENTGWNVMIKFEYVEIYNENINDLLSTKDIKIEIIHDENETIIKNSTSIFVKNSKDAMNILHGALTQRSVGYTKCNDRSSRKKEF
ncbi:kinesin-like nuclear fusion protein [Conglomerata obtusa]